MTHGFSVRYCCRPILPRLLEARAWPVAQAPDRTLDALAARGVAVDVVLKSSGDAHALRSQLQQVLRQVRFHLYARRTASSEILWTTAAHGGRDAARAPWRVAPGMRRTAWPHALRSSRAHAGVC